MRALLFVATALWAGAAFADAPANRHAKPVRTAQVIIMGQRSLPSPSTEPLPQIPPAPLEASMRSPAAYKAHDLSRKWVEFEMANSFATLDSSSSSAAAGPDGPVPQAGAADSGQSASGALRLPPAILIPAWMQSGATFAAGATSVFPGCAASAYRPSGFLAADAERRRSGYYAMMSSIACAYGIPVGLFDAMIIRESLYKADIFSPKRAFGLTQLMPDTAAGLGIDRFDTEQNLRGGARYLRQQLDRYGQVHLALAAYNAGPGRVHDGMMPRLAETHAYVENVLLNWRRLAGLSMERQSRRSAPSLTGSQARPFGRIAIVSSY